MKFHNATIQAEPELVRVSREIQASCQIKNCDENTQTEKAISVNAGVQTKIIILASSIWTQTSSQDHSQVGALLDSCVFYMLVGLINAIN